MCPVFSPDAIETDGSRQGITGSKSHLAKIRDLVALFPMGRGWGGLSAPRESLRCLYVPVHSSDSPSPEAELSSLAVRGNSRPSKVLIPHILKTTLALGAEPRAGPTWLGQPA